MPEIEITPAEAVDLAPLRIDAAEVGLQRRDGVAQSVDGQHIGMTLRMRGFRAHQHRQCRCPAADIGAPVPALEKHLGGTEVIVRPRIDLNHLSYFAGDVGALAIGDIELVSTECLGGDGRVGAEGLLCAIGSVGHAGLDAHGGAEVGRLQCILHSRGFERSVVGIEYIAGLGIPNLRHALERQVALPDQVGAIAGLDLVPVPSFGARRETGHYRCSRCCPYRRHRCS